MRDAFRGWGRNRGGGGWRGGQRAAVADAHHQQQWKSGPGLVSGPDTRHFNPREPRARPEREAEPPHGSVLPPHSPAPHRRRQQGQGLRKERTAPYEPRAVLGQGPHGASPVAAGGGGQIVVGGRGRVEEDAAPGGVPGQLPCSTPVQTCMPPPTVCCSIYADQLIDYYTGKICPRRFCVAYKEVCKLVRLPEATPAPAGSGLQHLPPAGVLGVARGDEGVQETQMPNGQQRTQAAALDADEMSEVSQVEEGEVDEEAPVVHSTRHTSQEGQQKRSAGVVNQLQGDAVENGPSAVKGPAAVSGSAAARQHQAGLESSHMQSQGVAAHAPSLQQQQQPVAAPNTTRRDPRLAARARAETGVQQQQEVVQQVKQPETSEPQQQPQQGAQDQQQQQQPTQWDPNALPPELRRQPLLSGKLPLLLDLDNTLLHAQAVGVAGYTIALEDWLDEDGLPELYKFELPCNRKVYYLKLRPGLRRFLRALAPVFELSIYTNATQEYADLVVAILDPDRSLFGDR
ncbi:NLI interacting factor-like phosphatase domain-containing protein, putative [Eimeria maxima]|uniref:protein-serine/threonine phosphatase n=1 Tax=Eimeria maxima TaxID=5804 RepID=U6M3J0_EIMMA|nr:NLI interacting factor-like phosphatase domain-containing protein, putative [Eimeria maxima]CDJ58561.1 NLI interacting factor-like phosphatase domain-containing protein, putative [Eimeria maxima]